MSTMEIVTSPIVMPWSASIVHAHMSASGTPHSTRIGAQPELEQVARGVPDRQALLKEGGAQRNADQLPAEAAQEEQHADDHAAAQQALRQVRAETGVAEKTRAKRCDRDRADDEPQSAPEKPASSFARRLLAHLRSVCGRLWKSQGFVSPQPALDQDQYASRFQGGDDELEHGFERIRIG
jgi:hypothetical protein